MTGRTFNTGRARAAIAAVAAYALFLQALLLSLGGALHAAETGGPPAVICVQDGEPGLPPVETHDGLCCVLGCHGSSPAGTGSASCPVGRIAPGAAAARFPGRPLVLRTASGVLPVGSRAPPRLG